MRSLFAKILGWFILTMFVTLVATVFTAALTYNPYSKHPAPFTMLVATQMREAQHAWETGGKPALEAALQRFAETTRIQNAILADSAGRDLLTGEDHRAQLAEGLKGARIPFSGRFGNTFVRYSEDGKYCYMVSTGSTNWFFWFQQLAHFGVLALVGLLCYAMAYHVTAPVRRLKKVLDRFGRGDLEARAEESRRDELGELAATFNRMADHIQALRAAERRLLLDISHELRSP